MKRSYYANVTNTMDSVFVVSVLIFIVVLCHMAGVSMSDIQAFLASL